MTLKKEALISELKNLRELASKSNWVAEHLKALLGEKNVLYFVYWHKGINEYGYDFEEAPYLELLAKVEQHANNLRYGYETSSKGTNRFIPKYLEKVNEIIERNKDDR